MYVVALEYHLVSLLYKVRKLLKNCLILLYYIQIMVNRASNSPLVGGMHVPQPLHQDPREMLEEVRPNAAMNVMPV